eukprot:TRINITY_DN17593_c0_g1_i1.p1 TRINITY_DN17593_c0_g1~~TRINITY_DN17593_c0_g1_i1.p1  ORF type:complete len:429 (+),score=83.41 TRINITY_DN17593_c0_g1_i1:17-1303(+)
MSTAAQLWSLCLFSVFVVAVFLEKPIVDKGTPADFQSRLANPFASVTLPTDLFARIKGFLVRPAAIRPSNHSAEVDRQASLDQQESEDDSGHVGHLVQQQSGFKQLFTEETLTVHSRGHRWIEGPTWMPADSYAGSKRVDEAMIVFSDVKTNQMHYYSPTTNDAGIFHEPSGCFEDTPVDCNQLIEPGSNGLVYHPSSRGILACQHGARRVALLVDNKMIPLATHYRGKRFNSPNDLALSPDGDLYFTDPSYGLNRREADPARELKLNGVYYINQSSLAAAIGKEKAVEPLRLRLEGVDVTKPNGIAVDPNSNLLYVAHCHPTQSFLVSCKLQPGKAHLSCGAFADVKLSRRLMNYGGCADGIKVDRHGRVWSTGPHGVHVFSPQGKVLGYIQTGAKTGNLVFGKDQRLYITASDKLLSIGLAEELHL